MRPSFRHDNDVLKPADQRFTRPYQVRLSQALGRPLPEKEDIVVNMHAVSIIHNNGQVMATSYGFNKS